MISDFSAARIMSRTSANDVLALEIIVAVGSTEQDFRLLELAKLSILHQKTDITS